MFIVVIPATGKLIGPFTSQSEADQYIERVFPWIENATIRKLHKP